MGQILYIGNKLEKHGATPTGVDTLSTLLNSEGYTVSSVSSFKNKGVRLLHMLFSVLTKRKIDIVLVDTYSTANFWYAILVAKLCRIISTPYIMILHGGNLENRLKSSSESILNVFKNAKFNIVPSNFLKHKLEHFNWGNLITIPNAIDLYKYPNMKREQLNHRILWVRAFGNVYNPKMALEVVEILKQNYPDVELYMIGPEKDGSLKELLKIVEENDLSVTFKGKMSKKDWTSFSKDFDIFINTSNYDNTPVSLIEAMALGLPVVSTNVGGVPYLIEDGNNGLLVDPNDAMAMARNIELLWQDAKLSQKLSLNGRKTSENFDWKKVKPLWLELLG